MTREINSGSKESIGMMEAVAKLKAVADDTRARILVCLHEQPLCLDHLTRILELAPSTLSAHLRVLSETGLVAMTREGHWRYYHIPEFGAADAGRELVDWLLRWSADDRKVADALGRRTVALAESDAPVPSFLKPKVLFLCTGNSCRSQMAEALLRAKAGDRFEVYSAGLMPRSIPELTLQVMDEIGVDARQQSPTDVLIYLGHLSFEHLITVCPDAESRCPVFPGVRNRLCWEIGDPVDARGTYEERLAIFRETRDELAKRIDQWLSELDDNKQG